MQELALLLIIIESYLHILHPVYIQDETQAVTETL